MRKDPHKHTDQEEPFLARWSRKKTATDDETGPVAETIPEQSPLKDELSTEPEAADIATLTDKDMPPVESLDENSDYSGFMSEGVSEPLRQLALRKLFRSAGFNIRDGLDDYDDDFTSFAALGDIITADMKHQMEMAEKRKREKEEEEAKLAQQEQGDEPAKPEDETAKSKEEAGATETAENTAETGTIEQQEPEKQEPDQPEVKSIPGTNDDDELT